MPGDLPQMKYPSKEDPQGERQGIGGTARFLYCFSRVLSRLNRLRRDQAGTLPAAPPQLQRIGIYVDVRRGAVIIPERLGTFFFRQRRVVRIASSLHFPDQFAMPFVHPARVDQAARQKAGDGFPFFQGAEKHVQFHMFSQKVLPAHV